MPCIRIVIEVYGGVAQNVYVADDMPGAFVEAVIVDWDYEYYDASNGLVRAMGFDGEPTLAAVFAATLKPWRLSPTAGIQDVLDRAGLTDFGSLRALRRHGEFGSFINLPPGSGAMLADAGTRGFAAATGNRTCPETDSNACSSAIR